MDFVLEWPPSKDERSSTADEPKDGNAYQFNAGYFSKESAVTEEEGN